MFNIWRSFRSIRLTNRLCSYTVRSICITKYIKYISFYLKPKSHLRQKIFLLVVCILIHFAKWWHNFNEHFCSNIDWNEFIIEDSMRAHPRMWSSLYYVYIFSQLSEMYLHFNVINFAIFCVCLCVCVRPSDNDADDAVASRYVCVWPMCVCACLKIYIYNNKYICL